MIKNFAQQQYIPAKFAVFFKLSCRFWQEFLRLPSGQAAADFLGPRRRIRRPGV
jgi:hypothetical protein